MKAPHTWTAFTAFLAGFAAARELHARAGNAGAFVECVCLGASLADALLRVGLVLKSQLDNRTTDIPLELVYQGPSDRPVSERDIYKRAHSQQVIDDSIFEQLQTLYDDRNRVIHRYIISRIATSDVLDIAIQYERMVQKLSKRVHTIEARQIEEGVGITVAGPAFEGTDAKRWLDQLADEKHTPVLGKMLRNS